METQPIYNVGFSSLGNGEVVEVLHVPVEATLNARTYPVARTLREENGEVFVGGVAGTIGVVQSTFVGDYGGPRNPLHTHFVRIEPIVLTGELPALSGDTMLLAPFTKVQVLGIWVDDRYPTTQKAHDAMKHRFPR